MAFFKATAVVSGVISEFSTGDQVSLGRYQNVQGSGLTVPPSSGSVNAAVAPQASGLIFVQDVAGNFNLGVDGSGQASANAAIVTSLAAQANSNQALLSGTQAESEAATALASGNAGIQLGLNAGFNASTALASGEISIELALAAETDADTAQASGNAAIAAAVALRDNNFEYALTAGDRAGTGAALIIASGVTNTFGVVVFSGQSQADSVRVDSPVSTLITISGAQPASAPAGTILFHGENTAPDGYLECDGSAVSRTTQATLFGVIGTRFGGGDGSTTFNLPDLRGVFVRGWDNGRGIDTGRGFGSAQDDSIPDHTHVWRAESGQDGQNINRSDPDGNAPTNDGGYNRGVQGIAPSSLQGVTDVTSEMRPRNLATLPIIKT